MPSKTVDHGAVIGGMLFVGHGSVILRSLTKTTAHGAKLIKTRTVSHGAEIVDDRGSYRGVMSEAERDALDPVYRGDTVITSDNSQRRPHQFYAGASSWVTSGQEPAVSESGVGHELFAQQILFPDFDPADIEDVPDITSTYNSGTDATLSINGAIWSGAPTSAPSITLAVTPTEAQVTINSDTYIFFNSPSVRFGASGVALHNSGSDKLQSDVHFVASDGVQGKYVSAAGRTNAADTDFTATPSNGTTAVVRNSSTGDVYFCVRANGAWKAHGPL